MSALHSFLDHAAELKREPAATLVAAFGAVQDQLTLFAAQPTAQVGGLGAQLRSAPLSASFRPEYKPEPMIDARDSGASAVVAYLCGSTLWVAGAGDARAVLGSSSARRGDGDDGGGGLSAIVLSTDHRVALPAERRRIEEAGGWVRPARGVGGPAQDFLPARMYERADAPWLGPGLAISRAIGDLNATRCGLVPTPEVRSHALSPSDRFLILATDGVWEFIGADEAVDIVHGFYEDGGTAFDAAAYLVAKAGLAWAQHEGHYRDDATAIVVWLPEVAGALLAGGGVV